MKTASFFKLLSSVYLDVKSLESKYLAKIEARMFLFDLNMGRN